MDRFFTPPQNHLPDLILLMTPRIIEVRPTQGYNISLCFSDGTRAEINLEEELYGEIFEPLRDPVFFRKVKVHPELNTITWPNDADFAPEFLYQLAKARQNTVSEPCLM